MIKDKQGLKVTKEQIAIFEQAQAAPATILFGVHPGITKAEKAALQSVLDELRAEVEEWEARCTPS